MNKDESGEKSEKTGVDHDMGSHPAAALAFTGAAAIREAVRNIVTLQFLNMIIVSAVSKAQVAKTK